MASQTSALSPAEIAAQMFPNNQAGRQAGEIRVPTLVADGTLDQDIRPPNAGLLANSVPGAKLLLFDDAGHAFLFQDAAGFIPAVDTFTG